MSFFDRQRSRRYRPQGWACSASRISGVQRDRPLMNRALIAHIVGGEAGARRVRRADRGGCRRGAAGWLGEAASGIQEALILGIVCR